MFHYKPYNKDYRAQRRLNGEDVFGRKIVVSNLNGSWRSNNSPHTVGRKVTKSNDQASGGYSRPQTPPGVSVQDVHFKKQSRELEWRESSREESGSNISHWQPLPISRSFKKVQNDNPFHDTNRYNQEKMYSSASSSFQPTPKPTSKHVELVITNLDPFFTDLRSVLLNLLKEHAIIYNLSLNNNQDGSPVAVVKVGSQQDAHNVISKMHHYKLGSKRLSISYAQTNGLDSEDLKEMVIMLLKEAPLNSMPLYRLLNLLEKRFLTSVSVYEVNKLRDVCRIIEENGERIVALTVEFRTSPLPSFNRVNILLCSFHCPNGLMNTFGMDDSDDGEAPEIPHIKMFISEFASKLNLMINSHNGTLPLLSFGICYKYEFGENLPLDSSGVPLEHLITCVNNVRLKYGGPNKNTKYIIRDLDRKPQDAEKEGLDKFMKTLSQGITANIGLLSREMVDLLKTTEKCQLLLSKFIPAYHHHFGRQLRVADYGFTKLSDLLYSQLISNVVQIIGEGNKRTITLTHSTQMRRFTSDLLRVLKNQASKQLQFNEFPAAYERVLTKSFNPVEYGLCSFEDLLSEVPENTIVISSNEDKFYIAIPKREQTIEEMLCTKQFAEEVVKLLSYTPQCSILFNKFVPAYHHHFGHQCRVSDYGFTKLIELFEAIPDTVKIEENSDGERKVSLTLSKTLSVRGNQIAELIKKSHLSYLPLEALASAFYREYGYILKPHTYECHDINELVTKLSDHIKISYSNAGPLLIPVESDSQSTLALRVWALLINPPHQLHLNDLIKMYNNHFQSNIMLSSLEQLNNVIINKLKDAEASIFLTPPYATAAKIYLLLYKEGGQVPYNCLNNLFMKYYGISLLSSENDTFENLFTDFSFLIIMRRTRKRTNIILNPKVKEYGLSLPNSESLLSDNFYSKFDDNVSWPPPPVHNLGFNTNAMSGISPPKPDTPPPPGSAPWKNWETPPKFNSENFTVSLPSPKASTFLLHPNTLISPTKSLLSANSYDSVSPPEPGALPIPDKLLKKGIVSDDSTDSGVNNSNIASENEMDMSCDLNAQTRMKSSL